jgi:hypothetical protein
MNERYTFIDIYKKELDLNKDSKVKISQVVIPKIQRPYAQGRLDGVCTYVRNTLLNEMFANFKTDEVFDFNFIYGIVRPSNDEYVMELLDGQQRMTTLFLVYWYIANRELTESDDSDKEVRDALNRFVYETRSTSTVFCHKLASYRIDLSEQAPSKVIRQAKWYFKSFDRDSTITAMLTMLDAIHERYNNQESDNLFPKLGNIQFYVKSLGFFNLSEELYIKMNARGLQLSPFENYKADLTNFISDKDYEPFKKMVPLYRKDSSEQVEFHFNFSVKLDAKWIDIFWKKGYENFDASYMSFFSRFFACKYIISTKDIVNDRDMRQDATLRKMYTEAENRTEANEYLGFQEFEQVLNGHPEYVLTLDKVLDDFYEYDYKDTKKSIYKMMVPSWEKQSQDDGDDFYSNISSKMTHTKLIVFGAVIEFIEAFEKFDVETFKQWMRIVWNVIENTNIDSLTPVSSLIRKFSAVIHSIARRMSDGDTFFYALSQWKEDNTDERENRALLEEVQKASCIADNMDWLPVFVDAERHPFFRGMVMFFYREDMSLEDYQYSLSLAKNMFDESGISPMYREDHLLIRAIASQFVTWQDLRDRFLTERAETNKYLKNILASNNDVRRMLSDVLEGDNDEEVKAGLADYIETAEDFTPWSGANEIEKEYCNMAVDRIRHDIKLYDWVSAEEAHGKSVLRVYWYEGHIMFAVPRKQFAKVALDTERAKIANTIALSYGFEYFDSNQLNMYNQYGDCFGNDIWLKQERDQCTLWIGFCQYHKIKIQFECKTKKFAKELFDLLEGCSYIDDDERWVQIPSLDHFKKTKTVKDLSRELEDIFDVVPESSKLALDN